MKRGVHSGSTVAPMLLMIAVLGAIIVVLCLQRRTVKVAITAAPVQRPTAVDEVLANIRAQKVGNHAVADYHLPEDFLRRLADRIIAESFEDRFRAVVHHEHGAEPEKANSDRSTGKSDPDDESPPDGIHRIDHVVPESVRQYWAGLREQRPPLNGYRAPILEEATRPWPFEPPDATSPQWLRQAADTVGRDLAKEGLLFVLAEVVQILDASSLASAADAAVIETLKAVGLPVDLLAMFDLPPGVAGRSAHPAISIVGWIEDQIKLGETPDTLRPRLESWPFRFKQSKLGFQVATESGQHDIQAIRLQLTRGSYWQRAGDGGNVDLFRQLVEKLPHVSFVASIQRDHAEEFLRLARTWPMQRPGRLELITEDLPLAQWAQDNGKAGFNEILVPRYASRGEDGSIFVPGESLLLDGLARAGLDIVQSPLLFQGGNVLAVRHPATGERLLLIGEAEVYRNTVLGLRPPQIIEAFRIEFGVDRCEVLPSVSFHIDYDVCVRAQGDRLVAFVNDVPAAARIVLQCAVDAMRASGTMSDADAVNARSFIVQDKWREFVESAGAAILSLADEHGHFSLTSVRQFAAPGESQESAVGNLHRILLALDHVASWAVDRETLPADSALRTYLEALDRRAAQRMSLHVQLQTLGFDVIPVPSLADAARGINAINGIHARGIFLMPAYGGLFTGLDEAAATVFEAALAQPAPVRVLPIHCSESQRRVGAVHCSSSILYAKSMRNVDISD